MLILKRRPGEALKIGDDVIIHFFPNHQIGIEAPREINIIRQEVLKRAVSACLEAAKPVQSSSCKG